MANTGALTVDLCTPQLFFTRTGLSGEAFHPLQFFPYEVYFNLPPPPEVLIFFVLRGASISPSAINHLISFSSGC